MIESFQHNIVSYESLIPDVYASLILKLASGIYEYMVTFCSLLVWMRSKEVRHPRNKLCLSPEP